MSCIQVPDIQCYSWVDLQCCRVCNHTHFSALEKRHFWQKDLNTVLNVLHYHILITINIQMQFQIELSKTRTKSILDQKHSRLSTHKQQIGDAAGQEFLSSLYSTNVRSFDAHCDSKYFQSSSVHQVKWKLFVPPSLYMALLYLTNPTTYKINYKKGFNLQNQKQKSRRSLGLLWLTFMLEWAVVHKTLPP